MQIRNKDLLWIPSAKHQRTNPTNTCSIWETKFVKFFKIDLWAEERKNGVHFLYIITFGVISTKSSCFRLFYQVHNVPGNCARKLFKPSKDFRQVFKSPIKKNYLVLGVLWVTS